MQWPACRHGSAFFRCHVATVEIGKKSADSMLTMSGFAPAPFFPPWRTAVGRMGVVQRIIAAYLCFVALSMLCFGSLTFLSLLP